MLPIWALILLMVLIMLEVLKSHFIKMNNFNRFNLNDIDKINLNHPFKMLISYILLNKDKRNIKLIILNCLIILIGIILLLIQIII